MSKQKPLNKKKEKNDFVYGWGARTKPGEKLMTSNPVDDKLYEEKDINGNYSLRSNYKFIQNNLMNIQNQMMKNDITEKDLSRCELHPVKIPPPVIKADKG